jgi:hypothetical protein
MQGAMLSFVPSVGGKGVLGAEWNLICTQARLKNPKDEDLWLAAVRTEQRAGNAKAADALMAKV